jgi:GNAT superfamily N-acetyltransferase
MPITTAPTTFEEIAPWRDLYRQEMNCQIIHDSLHMREGWTREYLLRVEDVAAGYGTNSIAGYGSVAIAGPWEDQPAIYEFYILPQYRHRLFDLFAALVAATGVTAVETQTNDVILASLLHALAPSVTCESILFHDHNTTALAALGAEVRLANVADAAAVTAAELDVDAKWVLTQDGVIAGTGGILFHYNRPYGDIYMAIAEPFRRRGLGAFLVQQLKAICYQQGSVPAARCRATNLASRKTLQKAGFVPCGNLICGTVST